MPEFNFIGPSYTSLSVNADCQRSMNLYPEVVESGAGKSRIVLYSTPGLSLFTTLPTTPVRGLWPGANRLFAVAGSKLYEVFSDGSYTDRGDVGNDGKPVVMIPNGNQLAIISDGKFYVDSGSGPVQPNFQDTTDPVTARYGCFLDGYFIVNPPDSKNIYISQLYDGLTWDVLDFQVKEGYPDNVGGLLADHEALWVFGDEAGTEIWHNNGQADFPFQRDLGAFQHYACFAPYSIVRLDESVAWIGGNEERGGPVAFQSRGFIPARVSTHAIEQKWRTYSRYDDAVAYSSIENGHSFWVITFPTANATWVYDTTTQMWHERGYWNGSSWDCVRGRFHAYVAIGAGNTPYHYVGDYANGKIYRQSSAYTDDAGTAIHWQRTAPHISHEMFRTSYSRFRLDHESPLTCTLSWSSDGGHTYNTPASGRGATGYTEWWRLGACRDRVFRVDGTGSARIINAYMEASPGLS